MQRVLGALRFPVLQLSIHAKELLCLSTRSMPNFKVTARYSSWVRKKKFICSPDVETIILFLNCDQSKGSKHFLNTLPLQFVRKESRFVLPSQNSFVKFWDKNFRETYYLYFPLLLRILMACHNGRRKTSPCCFPQCTINVNNVSIMIRPQYNLWGEDCNNSPVQEKGTHVKLTLIDLGSNDR